MLGREGESSRIVSEYQCYQWKKVGGSLSPKQRGEVSKLSSHISVGANSAEITYHYGDFKHDPISVLKCHFDLFLYEANWGTQRVAFRFDVDTVVLEELRDFAVGEVITVSEKGGSVLVEAWFDENWIEFMDSGYDEYNEPDWQLDAFGVIYRQLMKGDYRGLFLLWLKAHELDPEVENDDTVPIPEGMGQLNNKHGVVVSFIGVDQGVVEAAAERSDSLPVGKRQLEELDRYLDKLSPDRTVAYLLRLLDGDATSVQSALKRELRSFVERPRRSRSVKRVHYRELADAARLVAEQEARIEKEKKETRRREYLEELGRREDGIWERVHTLVSGKKTRGYEDAVRLLRGLEDLWSTRKDRAHFLRAVKLIVDEFPRLSGFHRRLEEAGMLKPKKETVYTRSRQERWSENNPLEREIDLNW